MTRCAVTSTAAAERDVRDIANYIAVRNPRAARQFAEELVAALARIGEFPEAGHALKGFEGAILTIRISRRFRKYFVFYRRLDPQTVEVVRILHGSRDLAKLLPEAR